MDFYMVLPSNASPDVYEDNKTSNFKTQLSKRIELHGDWQVALLEVHYPNTLTHIQQGENWIKVFTPNDRDAEDFVVADKGVAYVTDGAHTELPVYIYTSEETLHITPRFYKSKQDFIDGVREALTTKSSRKQSRVIELTDREYVTFLPFESRPGATYTLAPTLAMQLGLPHAGPYHADEEVRGEHPIDMTLGMPFQMYIYIDIIQDQIVGHTSAPLLRTIPVNTLSSYGGVSSYRCDPPIYFDLKTKSFDTIEVNIRTHTGEFLPFQHGTSTLLCHFKQRT